MAPTPKTTLNRKPGEVAIQAAGFGNGNWIQPSPDSHLPPTGGGFAIPFIVPVWDKANSAGSPGEASGSAEAEPLHDRAMALIAQTKLGTSDGFEKATRILQSTYESRGRKGIVALNAHVEHILAANGQADSFSDVVPEDAVPSTQPHSALWRALLSGKRKPDPVELQRAEEAMRGFDVPELTSLQRVWNSIASAAAHLVDQTNRAADDQVANTIFPKAPAMDAGRKKGIASWLNVVAKSTVGHGGHSHVTGRYVSKRVPTPDEVMAQLAMEGAMIGTGTNLGIGVSRQVFASMEPLVLEPAYAHAGVGARDGITRAREVSNDVGAALRKPMRSQNAASPELPESIKWGSGPWQEELRLVEKVATYPNQQSHHFRELRTLVNEKKNAILRHKNTYHPDHVAEKVAQFEQEEELLAAAERAAGAVQTNANPRYNTALQSWLPLIERAVENAGKAKEVLSRNYNWNGSYTYRIESSRNAYGSNGTAFGGANVVRNGDRIVWETGKDLETSMPWPTQNNHVSGADQSLVDALALERLMEVAEEAARTGAKLSRDLSELLIAYGRATGRTVNPAIFGS